MRRVACQCGNLASEDLVNLEEQKEVENESPVEEEPSSRPSVISKEPVHSDFLYLVWFDEGKVPSPSPPPCALSSTVSTVCVCAVLCAVLCVCCVTKL